MNFRALKHCLLLALLAFATSTVAQEKAPIKIVLVGDSTVHTPGGWGDAFSALLKPDAAVGVNLGRSGNSTKSYLDQGSWATALKERPAFVLIQFGHNDQPGKGPARETDPQTTYPENLRRFVHEARAAGTQPILVTSLVRRVWDRKNVGHLRVDLEPYVEAMRKVAAEEKVELVDLHARSKELVEKLGPEGAKVLDADRKENAPGTGGDGTHLSAKGAEMIAPLVAGELHRIHSKLEPYLR